MLAEAYVLNESQHSVVLYGVRYCETSLRT